MKIFGMLLMLWMGTITLLAPDQIKAAPATDLVAYSSEESSAPPILKPKQSDNRDLYENSGQSESDATALEKQINRIKVLVLPSLPGALLLFAFSAFFSSVNFFSEVQEQSLSTISVYRYLSVWILINYLFALIILFLILDDPTKLQSLNKTLFISCLLATAIPEISANIRLQLGRSNRSLDLYKYKLKISGMISRKVTQANIDKRSQQLISLAMYYSNRMDLFNQKLHILMGQSDLSEEEKEGLNRLMEFVTSGSKDMTIEQAVSVVLARFQSIVPKLLNFFHADISRFEHSPVFVLLNNLQPLLTVDEARRLVESGITSPARFSNSCANESKRKKLSEKTGIDIHRITMLYYSSHQEYQHKRYRNLSWSALVILIICTNLFLLVKFNEPVMRDWLPHQDEIQSGDLSKSANTTNTQPLSGSMPDPTNMTVENQE